MLKLAWNLHKEDDDDKDEDQYYDDGDDDVEQNLAVKEDDGDNDGDDENDEDDDENDEYDDDNDEDGDDNVENLAMEEYWRIDCSGSVGAVGQSGKPENHNLQTNQTNKQIQQTSWTDKSTNKNWTSTSTMQQRNERKPTKTAAFLAGYSQSEGWTWVCDCDDNRFHDYAEDGATVMMKLMEMWKTDSKHPLTQSPLTWFWWWQRWQWLHL